MIVLLDTTVLGADALCGGDAWQALALGASSWGVRIGVTEVTVAEAVGNYGREIEKKRTGLRGWAEKRLGSLGLWPVFETADAALTDAAENYADRLRERLELAGADILPVADVSHIELVGRASARKRPCDDDGDGYRDTLNWLTLLALAKAEPGQEIIWVSRNTLDFGSGEQRDEPDFHPHLVEDLESISARGRVSWKLTLADVVLSLAARHSPGSESDLKLLKEKVRNDSVLDYLGRELPAMLLSRPVDARRCALPLGTVSATLADLVGIRDLALDVKGVLPDEQAIAEFTVLADGGIDTRLLVPSEESGTDATAVERYINKPLLFRGLITLGEFARPVGVELAAIEALPDDPGRGLWNAVPGTVRIPPELLRQFGEMARSYAVIQESVRQWQMTEGRALDGIRSLHTDLESFGKLSRWVNEHQDSLRQALQGLQEFHRLRGLQGLQATGGFPSAASNEESDLGAEKGDQDSGPDDDIDGPGSDGGEER